MGRGGRKNLGGAKLADARGARSAGSFETGVSAGTIAQPDERDPRISGYRNVSKNEAYQLLAEIKEKEPHRITRGLDLTDFDHVHSLVLPRLRQEELREYQAMVAREREEELREAGINNTEAYNTSLPTAREAGAQYDIHAENITLGDSFEIAEGEKARLPGGTFIIGPGLVEVVKGRASSKNEKTGEMETGLAVRISTPLGQGINTLRDPFSREETAAPDGDALREEWITARAQRIEGNTQGKRPLSEEEAAAIISKNPRKYGFEGERYTEDGKRAYDLFAKEEVKKLVQKSQNDRQLGSAEARRVAEEEYEEIKPRHRLEVTLRADGRVYASEPISNPQRDRVHPVNLMNGIYPKPLVWGPSYIDYGDNPVIS